MGCGDGEEERMTILTLLFIWSLPIWFAVPELMGKALAWWMEGVCS